MIGVFSFIMCLVAMIFSWVVVYRYEDLGESHDKLNRLFFLIIVAMFGIVSYL